MITTRNMTTEIQNQEVTVEFLQHQLNVERLRSESLEGNLETEKMKTQGMQMLFDCMQEEHCENRRLKNIIKIRKLTLRKLKKRLQANPNAVSQIDWEELSDFSEVEEFIERGTPESTQKSKEEEQQSQNFESLCRSLNRNCSVEQLQRRIEQLILENEQLSAQLKSSRSEKDADTPTRKLHPSDVEHSRKTSGIMIDASSEEAIVLKRQLMETAEMCQKLMKTLETKQGFVKKIMNFKPVVDKLNGVEVTVTTSQRTHEDLDKKLKEVVTMNSRWQQYNEQREEYVRQLLQRNVELEQDVVNREQQLSLGQQERIDQILVDQKQKLELAREEVSTLKKENQSLRNRLEQMQDENNEVIQTLRESYAQDVTKYKSAVRMHVENIETLNLQIEMYREDFESERRDRERAQDHIIQLDAQIRSATRQLNMSRIHASPERMRASDPHLNIHRSFSPDASLVGRGSVSLMVDDRSDDSGELDLRPSD